MAVWTALTIGWLYVWGAVAMFAWLTVLDRRDIVGMAFLSIAWPVSVPFSFAITVRRSLAKKDSTNA
jgi:hypothetical protein